MFPSNTKRSSDANDPNETKHINQCHGRRMESVEPKDSRLICLYINHNIFLHVANDPNTTR
jgi:hypothetical protein